ncbi:MAG: GIY-YIG nuclease family protein [Patescibacteria group bacterium]
MYYVYLLQSVSYLDQHYVGYTPDLKNRLKDHNEGKSKHTSKFKPWKLIYYSAFADERKAKEFEKYLKTGSGRAFLKRHFLAGMRP